VGIDESEQMLEVAGDRVAEHGWDNVRLLAAPVAQAPIDGTADAALSCAVHDVLQSPAALAHVFDHLHPGAPVARPAGVAPPVVVAGAGLGGGPAGAVRPRFHRLRPAVAAVD
jgi:hypothetical protein